MPEARWRGTGAGVGDGGARRQTGAQRDANGNRGEGARARERLPTRENGKPKRKELSEIGKNTNSNQKLKFFFFETLGYFKFLHT